MVMLFFANNFKRSELEQKFERHCVLLVETHRNMYCLTPKNQSRNLTSGHETLGSSWVKQIKRISLDASRRAEHDEITCASVSLFCKKLLTKDGVSSFRGLISKHVFKKFIQGNQEFILSKKPKIKKLFRIDYHIPVHPRNFRNPNFFIFTKVRPCLMSM